jgi:hypothetical protein
MPVAITAPTVVAATTSTKVLEGEPIVAVPEVTHVDVPTEVPVDEVAAVVTMQHTTTGRWTIMAMLLMVTGEVMAVMPDKEDMLWTIDLQNAFRISAAALKSSPRLLDTIICSFPEFPYVGVRRAPAMGWRRVPHTLLSIFYDHNSALWCLSAQVELLLSCTHSL